MSVDFAAGGGSGAGAVAVHGSCASRFGRVEEAFCDNFRLRGEIGASVSVIVDDTVVVDLYGGTTGTSAWTSETLVTVWSATKGPLAVALHLLASEGELDLDAPLAGGWPAFRSELKREISPAMLLNHQAGLPAITNDNSPIDALDFEQMVARSAEQTPAWKPGTAHGYHSFTFGWLVGGLIARLTGTTPGRFLAEYLARPLGADFAIGVSESDLLRVARAIWPAAMLQKRRQPFLSAAEQPGSLQEGVMRSWGILRTPHLMDEPQVLAAEIPAANGVATARGLASMYHPLATDGRYGDRRLTQRSLRRLLEIESASGRDLVTLEPSRFTCGLQAPVPAGQKSDLVELPLSARGHAGFGGAVGFADPVHRLSFGYVMNRHSVPYDYARSQALIDAVYASRSG